MGKFHSTVSRREFMKSLGLGAAGVGIAAATTPVFHDLDEVLSSPEGNLSRPWWITEREEYNPTVDVDWDIMERFNRENNAQNSSIEDYFWGDQMRAARDNEDAVEQALIDQEAPGYTRKTVAYWNGSYRSYGFGHDWVGPDPDDLRWRNKPDNLPKWQGTPEENSKMLRTVSRVNGAAWCGFDVVDDYHWRQRLIVKHYTQRYGGLTILYEDVDQGYIKDNAKKDRVLPSKQMYAFTAGAPEALFNIKTAPSYFSAGNRFGNFFMPHIYAGMWQFLRQMGYQMLSDWGHQNAPVNEQASTILSGIGEYTRQNLYTLTPESGTRINMQTAFTDMPLAPTHPIDAGMWKFCQTCTKCAEVCPIECISFDKEPTYDALAPVNGKPAIFHTPGPKGLWCDEAACRMQRKLGGGACHLCYSECTFNEGQYAMIHNMVKGMVATTSVLNGFFANMSETFGFGGRDKEAWWDQSLPIFGCDSETYARWQT